MGIVKYNLVSRKNPITKEYAFHAQKDSFGAQSIDTNTLYAAMATNAHIPLAQIPAAFHAIVKSIENFCLNGHSVTIPDLGSFRLTIHSASAATEEDFTKENIRGLRMRFVPASKLRYEMNANISFVRNA